MSKESKELEELRKFVREAVKNKLKEMTGSGAAGAFSTPKAFGSTNKKSAEADGMKLISREQEEDSTTVKEEDVLPFITRHFEKIAEGLDPVIRPTQQGEELTPRQKIYQMTRDAKKSVDSIELLLDKILSVKKEGNVNSDDYYKRTHKALSVMNEKIKRCILKMNSMK